jgi:hypothetical protein
MLAVPTTIDKRFLSGLLHNEWIKSLKQEFTSINPEKYRQDNLLRQIEAAESHGKLAVGIDEVYTAVQYKKGKLLIGEKAYLFPNGYGKLPLKNIRFHKAKTSTIALTEIIDAAIEMVVQEGGAIEFVEKDMLKKYRRMVMIEQD